MAQMHTLYGHDVVADGSLVHVMRRFADPDRLEPTAQVRASSIYTGCLFVVKESDLRLEDPAEPLPREILFRRIAEFVSCPANEHNEELWTKFFPEMHLQLHNCSRLPDCVVRDPELLARAIRQGYYGVVPGRSTAVALAQLEQYRFLHADNVPDDQDWIEEHVMHYECLWDSLEPERRALLVTKFVCHGHGLQLRGSHDYSGTYHDTPRFKAILDSVPEHLHEAVREAHAARFFVSDTHPELGMVCRVVMADRPKLKWLAALRGYSFATLSDCCRKAIVHGMPGDLVAVCLRDELRKRKLRMTDYSDELLGFLIAHLPETEALALDNKFQRVTKKRDRDAFEADEW